MQVLSRVTDIIFFLNKMIYNKVSMRGFIRALSLSHPTPSLFPRSFALFLTAALRFLFLGGVKHQV